MKTGKEILTSVLKTLQLDQIGIRSALESSMCPALRKTLESQLRELDSIETEALSIATQRGWDLEDLDPVLCFITDRLTRIQLKAHNTDSKIAGIMIQRNTKGMIQGLKNIHQFVKKDDQIRILSQKLLDCETANIRHMQIFL